MSIPQNVDFDKFATITLKQITTAILAWLKGKPISEEALMSHLTGKLNERRGGCDVGVFEEIKMTTQLAELHRKGSNQIDQYGCDFAVTLVIEPDNWTKTALFQLKTFTEFRIQLEKRQLSQALTDTRIKNRSYVLVTDENRTGIRIRSIKEVINSFDNIQAEKTFHVSNWDFLVQWLWEWLSCNTGEISKRNDSNSIETLLQAFVDDPAWVPDWIVSYDQDLIDGYLPARAWLVIFLTTSDVNSPLNSLIKKKERRDDQVEILF
jgi:hypothetical protein